MKIELKYVKISELYNGYVDSDDEGVKAYGGLLDVRPKYQREFIYKDKQREAVIDTVMKGFPLNIMYWVKNINPKTGKETYEVLDGQQRTISICQYLSGDFSFKNRGFHNLQPDEQEKIKNYKLTVYLCEGNDSEKLDWFKTINIAGEELTEQELRNAVYAGSWLTYAKKDFSKRNCRGYKKGGKYIKAKVDRQELLEKVLDWVSHGNIEDYMGQHQHDPNANKLWEYYAGLIEWIHNVFPNYRREMLSVNWGELYNKYQEIGNNLDPQKTEQKISQLMADEDVSSKKGIYAYVLTGEEKYLNIRVFDDHMKRTAYEKQKGLCSKCQKPSRLTKWKLIILLHGVREAKQLQRIAKCFVETAIVENLMFS